MPVARQDDGKDLLSAWQEAIGEEDDPLRRLAEVMLQRLLEEEMSEFLGAAPHERTEKRRGYRNGHRPRTLTTRVGKLELLVPRDREGRFSTELFERYQRSEKAFVLALMEMYVQGVSTRKVKRITEKLCGLEVSSSQVSELAKGLDEQVEVWRSRPIEKRYPYLVVDALFEKVRHGPHVESDAVLVVTGVREDGYRQHLGAWCGNTESEQTWSEVFADLRSRGLEGVRYVVSDAHEGIRSAVARHFQGALWQRCQVHFKRNVLGKIRRKDRDRVAGLLKDVTDAASLQEARKALAEAVRQLEERYPDVARMLEEEGEEMLAVYALPPGHRKRMRSTNMLERWFEEVRRRTRVVRIFPNRAACIRLIAAHAMEINEEWLGRRYLRMEAEQIQEAISAFAASERPPSVLAAPGSPSASSTLNLEM
jgi:putative transposase